MIMILQLFRWWYGPGWILAFRRINVRTANVAHAFSAGTLLKTLFAPWKRIQYTGRSFDDKMRALADNLVSRVVGFTVRMGVLIAAGVMIVGSFVVGVLIAIAWPMVPLLIAYCLYRGIF